MTTEMPKLLNYLFLLLLLYILFYFLVRKNPLEYFTSGVFGFDPGLYTTPSQLNIQTPPPLIGDGTFLPCTPENNCFPGTTARTQIYQNLCQPQYGLLRQPIFIQDDCQRTLSPYYNPHIHK